MLPALILAGYVYLLWVLFLAVMALHHAWETLPPWLQAVAAPAVLVAVLLDIGLNVLATLPFADLPDEWTFSQRLGRYKYGGYAGTWRCSIARWICANLLDPFQIGGHCR